MIFGLQYLITIHYPKKKLLGKNLAYRWVPFGSKPSQKLLLLLRLSEEEPLNLQSESSSKRRRS